MKDVIRVLKVLDDNELLNQVSIGFYHKMWYYQQLNTQPKYRYQYMFEINCFETIPNQKFEKTKQQLIKLGIKLKLDKNLRDRDNLNMQTSIKSIFPIIATYQPLIKKLSEQSFKNNFGKDDLFQLNVLGFIIINQGQNQSTQFHLKITADQKDRQSIAKFKNLLKDVDGSIYKLEAIQYIRIPPIKNAQCADCQAKLKFPFYWSKWDSKPNTYRCRQCVQNKSNHKEKNASYFQNNILLNRDQVSINLNKFGETQKQGNNYIFKAHPALSCRACGQSPQKNGEIRYMCLGCLQYLLDQKGIVHFCQKCFDKYQVKDQAVLIQLLKSNHASYHPWLRIPIKQ